MDTNVPRLVWVSGLIAPCLFWVHGSISCLFWVHGSLPCLFWVHGFLPCLFGFMDSTMPLLGSWLTLQLSTTSGFVSIGGIVLLPLWVNGCQLSHASWFHGFQISLCLFGFMDVTVHCSSWVAAWRTSYNPLVRNLTGLLKRALKEGS